MPDCRAVQLNWFGPGPRLASRYPRGPAERGGRQRQASMESGAAGGMNKGVGSACRVDGRHKHLAGLGMAMGNYPLGMCYPYLYLRENILPVNLPIPVHG